MEIYTEWSVERTWTSLDQHVQIAPLHTLHSDVSNAAFLADILWMLISTLLKSHEVARFFPTQKTLLRNYRHFFYRDKYICIYKAQTNTMTHTGTAFPTNLLINLFDFRSDVVFFARFSNFRYIFRWKFPSLYPSSSQLLYKIVRDCKICYEVKAIMTLTIHFKSELEESGNSRRSL